MKEYYNAVVAESALSEESESMADAVQNWGVRLTTKRRKSGRRSKSPDAALEQDSAALESGNDALQPPDAELKTLFPFLRCLSPRQFRVLRDAGLRGFPENTRRHLDITQSAGRGQFMTDYVSTVTPKGRKYLTDRCRPILGLEGMALQSIFFPENVAKLMGQFSNDLLGDLAGNAFEGSCCAATIFSSCMLLARGACPVAIPPSLSSAQFLDDDLAGVWGLGSSLTVSCLEGRARAPRFRLNRKTSGQFKD